MGVDPRILKDGHWKENLVFDFSPYGRQDIYESILFDLALLPSLDPRPEHVQAIIADYAALASGVAASAASAAPATLGGLRLSGDLLPILAALSDLESKVSTAEVDAIRYWFALQVLSEARLEAIAGLVLSIRDPMAEAALSAVRLRLERMRSQELAEMSAIAQARAAGGSAATSIAKGLLSGAVGHLLAPLLGISTAATAAASSVAAIWFYSWKRQVDLAWVEAQLVLISTIDCLGFESAGRGPANLEAELEAVRRELSSMARAQASEYLRLESFHPDDGRRAALGAWVDGWPHYRTQARDGDLVYSKVVSGDFDGDGQADRALVGFSDTGGLDLSMVAGAGAKPESAIHFNPLEYEIRFNEAAPAGGLDWQEFTILDTSSMAAPSLQSRVGLAVNARTVGDQRDLLLEYRHMAGEGPSQAAVETVCGVPFDERAWMFFRKSASESCVSSRVSVDIREVGGRLYFDSFWGTEVLDWQPMAGRRYETRSYVWDWSCGCFSDVNAENLRFLTEDFETLTELLKDDRNSIDDRRTISSQLQAIREKMAQMQSSHLEVSEAVGQAGKGSGKAAVVATAPSRGTEAHGTGWYQADYDASGWNAHDGRWDSDNGEFAVFRRVITLESPPQSASLSITADNFYLVLINDVSVPGNGFLTSDGNWRTVDNHDVASSLVKGDNTIVIVALDMGSPRHLSASMTIDGRVVTSVRDGEWRSLSTRLENSWYSNDFDTRDWNLAVSPHPNAPGEPVAPSIAMWDPSGAEIVVFRRVFDLASIPASAMLRIAVDDAYAVVVNNYGGGGVGTIFNEAAGDWRTVESYDVTTALSAGPNILAIVAVDIGSFEGAFVELEIDGRLEVSSTDGNWNSLPIRTPAKSAN